MKLAYDFEVRIKAMAVASSQTKTSTPSAKTNGISRKTLNEWLTGYLFILPSFLVIGIFGLFPIGYAIYMLSLIHI